MHLLSYPTPLLISSLTRWDRTSSQTLIPIQAHHITVTYQFLTQQTNFQCTNPAVGDIAARQYWLPTAITLPDSSTLGITYETTPGYPSSVTGRIATITLPTGATVTYAYTGANNGIDCATGIPPTMTRNTPDGIWTYAFTPPAAGSYTSTVTKTDPTGNKTVYTFWGSGTAPSSYYSPRYETQRVMYNATTMCRQRL